MGKKYTITIKKRSQAGWLMWLLLVLPFMFGTLNEFLNMPREIRYVLDIAWLWLLVLMGRGRRKNTVSPLVLWSILFVVYTALIYLTRYQSVLYYLWGVRNNFRLFVAFFAFTTFLKRADIEGYFKLLDTLFWINAIVALVQYFAYAYMGDHLGGIFGVESGCNGYMNVFFVIILTKDILLYIEKKEKLSTCILICVTAVLLATLAELKFFFVEVLLIIVLASLFTEFTWRKFLVIIGGLAVIIGFAMLLMELFPNFVGFLSVEWFLEAGSTNTGYTSSGDLNRLNAIPQINKLWLTNFWQRIFGMGLGNCDTASFDLLNTPFFKANGDMHYTWLSYAFMYLETGWIGLVFYYGFFVMIYLLVNRIEKRNDGMIKTYCRMSRILTLLCMMIAVYNSSLRTEAGYMMFFALSIPFVLNRELKQLRYNNRNLAKLHSDEKQMHL